MSSDVMSAPRGARALRVIFAAATLSAVSWIGGAGAQSPGKYPFEEYERRVNAARNVAPLDSGAFGEQVSGFDGATSFELEDIVLPGSGAIPVSLGRRRKIESRAQPGASYEEHFLGGFGDWDLRIPYVETLVAEHQGWVVGPPADTARYDRCSRVSPPFVSESTLVFHWHDFWDGYTLSIPGVGGGQLMSSVAGAHGYPSDGHVYPWVTSGNIRLRCLPTTKNGYAGQAFAAVTPGGLTYYLDWAIERKQLILMKYDDFNQQMAGLGRKRVFFAATRVEDRFGNWVDYAYSGDKLQSITSSDGRSIRLTWSGTTIASATDGSGRTWRYEYAKDAIGATNLASVANPDGARWRYSLSDVMADSIPLRPDPEIHYNPCDTISDSWPAVANVDYRIEHPSGLVGTFNFNFELVSRAIDTGPCPVHNFGPSWYTLWSLKSKRIEGVGVPAQHYAYATDFSPGANGVKWNSITRPDGTVLRSQYGTGLSWRSVGGTDLLSGTETLLLAEQVLDAAGVVRETREYAYALDPAVDRGFPPRLGMKLGRNLLADEVVRPLVQTRIVRPGDEFTSTVQQFDAFARPRISVKSGRFNRVP